MLWSQFSLSSNTGKTDALHAEVKSARYVSNLTVVVKDNFAVYFLRE
jgi:hypothetical protein